MDPQELRAWLRLLLTPRVGPGTARKLLAALGSPQAVFDASVATLSSLVSPRDAQALHTPPEGLDEQVQLSLAWLAAGPDNNATAHTSAQALATPTTQPERAILSLADARYPSALLEAEDPPLLLYVQGQLRLLGTPAVALVGSRHPTAQGSENAHAFAQALSEAGLCVISGMADGIDGAAHEGALAAVERIGPGAGSTIAVVGTGLDRVYPRKHLDLARRMAQHGLLVSEFTLGTPPLVANFPRRNRIVAALSRGTLVAEAALQSGSLITARLAAEMGREVFAIPGSIHSPQSRGCHALIKQGAKLVETAQDVLEELAWGAAGRQASSAHSSMGLADLRAAPGKLALPPSAHHDLFTPQARTQADPPDTAHGQADDFATDAIGLPLPPDGDAILSAMGFEPVSQEALSARTGLGPAELGARLLELELCGQVARLPGQLFQRQARA